MKDRIVQICIATGAAVAIKGLISYDTAFNAPNVHIYRFDAQLQVAIGVFLLVFGLCSLFRKK